MYLHIFWVILILMLQVDSLWTALHTEATKVPNGTCIFVLKDTSELINKKIKSALSIYSTN